MTDLTTDELSRRIVRSLKENSAEFADARRREIRLPLRNRLFYGSIFVSGVIVGIFLATTKAFGQFAELLLKFFGH